MVLGIVCISTSISTKRYLPFPLKTVKVKERKSDKTDPEFMLLSGIEVYVSSQVPYLLDYLLEYLHLKQKSEFYILFKW